MNDLVIIARSSEIEKYIYRSKVFEYLTPYIKRVVDLSVTPDGGNLENESVLLLEHLSYFGHRNELAENISKAKRLVWIGSDYTYPPPTQIRNAVEGKPNVVLSPSPMRFDRTTWEWVSHKNWFCVDWNKVLWQPREFVEPRVTQNLYYFGRHRNGRRKSYKRFFETDKYGLSIACGESDLFEYQKMCPGLTGHTTYYSNEFHQRFATTIYIADEFHKDHFCDIACRFYECLSAGVAILVDIETRHIFLQHGIDPLPYCVANDEDVKKLLPMWDEIRKAQRKSWSRDYDYELREELKGVMGQW